MIIKRNNQANGRKSKKLALASILLTCSLAAGNGSAMGPVVEVGPNLIQSILNQINTYSQRFADTAAYANDAKSWLDQLNHMKQQLINMQSLLSSVSMPNGTTWTKVNANTYLVEESCNRGGGGLSVSGLLSMIGLDPAGDWVAKQKEICVNIRRARNEKYNYTVEFVMNVAPQMQNMLKTVNTRRNSSNTQGNVAAVDSSSNEISNDLALKFQIWQGQMQTYDVYIATMEENQRTLAYKAMKGQQTILGSLVKTGALATALKVGN
ncbi:MULTISPECIES: hypothetical protein [unclassified Lysobacter]|uniref:hypothetical protein n=1 Tax=unclassified Lysobacter TaxID=2635362 RepID=UPI0006F64C25|nr:MULTISPECIES: hypothetical protein [unclassified Lysobacter]KRA20932.1 hypothetical protein ASD69_06445 [Lysobacter sp. Root604]KRD39939.1 hypothetical protein ASE35_06395 [Lysobacter sp. Root916]KRD79965.1 hypothetical protein ASE43_03490 [Lysobacter sp. Root983]